MWKKLAIWKFDLTRAVFYLYRIKGVRRLHFEKKTSFEIQIKKLKKNKKKIRLFWVYKLNG